MNRTYEKYIDEYKKDIIKHYFYGKDELLNKLYGFEDRGEFTIQVLDELLDLEKENQQLKKQKDELEKENQQLKEKLNCKEYFSSTMPEDTEFVILTKNNYDRQQKDLALENIQLKKQKDDVVEYIKELDGDYDLELANCVKYEILRMLGEIDE